MTNNDNKKHWDKFYTDNGICRIGNSPFAKWLVDNKYIHEADEILEFGCGRGGDARFLANNTTGMVLGTDISSQAINDAKHMITSPNNVFWSCVDFITHDFQFRYDVIYSRFTMHCLNFANQKKFLQKAHLTLKYGGRLCVEVRSTKDPLCGQGQPAGKNAWISGHFRCFVDYNWLLQEITKSNYWNILFLQESGGWSRFNGENPVLIRLVAQVR